MEENKMHSRHFRHFKKGKNTVQTIKKTCAVYGSDAVAERTVQNFKRRDNWRSAELCKNENNRRDERQIRRSIRSAVGVEILKGGAVNGSATGEVLNYARTRTIGVTNGKYDEVFAPQWESRY
ncbi:hypothetical protein X777_05400 [Ooceraea biroi]|uniref:Mos1 transposase HTH domain-containing protein n=1 Tax=Ooceraea biroi TaxID=2015173 RepID=A0A026WFR8_OOCBI|nr:hypothetical protein X777_05400 [Ooceraea biroi]